jgi:hypothetical protein
MLLKSILHRGQDHAWNARRRSRPLVGGLIALSIVFWLIERWAGMVNRASLYLADAV